MIEAPLPKKKKKWKKTKEKHEALNWTIVWSDISLPLEKQNYFR